MRIESRTNSEASATNMSVRRQDGTALVVATLAMLVLTALGAAIALTTSWEAMIAANFRSAGEAFHAASAALDLALGDLRTLPDWTGALDGTARASFADGPPSGQRTLADGSRIDLSQIVNDANCRKNNACSDGEMNALTADRPWGANNPRWRPYAFGRLADALGTGSVDSAFYLVALVADDPAENDGDPSRDGTLLGGLPNPGAGVLTVRGEAFGPAGAHRAVEATVARIGTSGAAGSAAGGLRILSWHEVR